MASTGDSAYCSRAFMFMVIVVAGYTLAVSIVNAVHFEKLHVTPNSVYSATTYTTLLWLNIIMAILATIILFWAIITFSRGAKPGAAAQTVYGGVKKWGSDPIGGRWLA